MILILIAIPADANFLHGYALNGSVLVGYVLNGYVLVGYVLVGYVCDSCWCTPFEWIRIEWIRIAWIRIGGIRFEWICEQNLLMQTIWMDTHWMDTYWWDTCWTDTSWWDTYWWDTFWTDMCGICVVWWICVGYVWCEIRQQSSEEPCDETSFGKKQQQKLSKSKNIRFFKKKKCQGSAECKYTQREFQNTRYKSNNVQESWPRPNSMTQSSNIVQWRSPSKRSTCRPSVQEWSWWKGTPNFALQQTKLDSTGREMPEILWEIRKQNLSPWIGEALCFRSNLH